MQQHTRGVDGIEHDWNSSTPIVEEVIEEVLPEGPDPLQSDDPWGNSRLPSEVLPAQVDPPFETTTTESWSVDSRTEEVSSPAAAEAAPTTGVSPPTGEEPPAPRLSMGW